MLLGTLAFKSRREEHGSDSKVCTQQTMKAMKHQTVTTKSENTDLCNLEPKLKSLNRLVRHQPGHGCETSRLSKCK